MKVFRDLYIRLNGARIKDLIEQFTAQCGDHWHRALDREKDAGSMGEKAFSFEHTAGDGLERAGLSLFQKEGDTWYVPNIIPLDSSQLSHDQYNKILENFLDTIVRPSIAGLPVTAELSGDVVFLKDVVGEDVAVLLHNFSVLANKSTGSAHPCDRNRWFDFLIAVQRKHISLDTDLLIHSLMEDGWSEDRAHDLAIEYEFAIGLLDYKEGK
ncbi:hypothetical protein GURASL_16100 [Geotalea uraniireducens]|uniref:Uncharacterized protein n=1 Tax=Geotalea uraniireducens TaxID=351604 RepID=A0ABN6VWP3_9BACT|nr:hypothetical protein [Geotalea uraniireducens]BDV42687.1 hypothetical protein GURASL_16100 [Geotalea uraniireducens]